jgi:hypothetical protein
MAGIDVASIRARAKRKGDAEEGWAYPGCSHPESPEPPGDCQTCIAHEIADALIRLASEELRELHAARLRELSRIIRAAAKARGAT